MTQSFLSLALLAACAGPKQTPATDTAQPAADTGAPRASAGTAGAAGTERSLLEGHLGASWRGYKSDGVPAGWTLGADGVVTKTGTTGDLISRDQFGDFEFDFDWKVVPAGNAGIFYRATEEYDHVYWSGPEYQLLDDARHPDGKNRLTSAAAAYGLYPSPAGIVKPANEWNTGRIVVRGSHVEHWLNGQKAVEYELGSADWSAKVAAAKFKEYPNYGRAARGHIGIQGDHEGTLQLRNLRIRALP